MRGDGRTDRAGERGAALISGVARRRESVSRLARLIRQTRRNVSHFVEAEGALRPRSERVER